MGNDPSHIPSPPRAFWSRSPPGASRPPPLGGGQSASLSEFSGKSAPPPRLTEYGKKGAGDRLPRFPGPVQPPPQRRHGCLCVPPRLRVSNNIAPKAAPGGAGTLRRLAPHRRPDEVDEIDDPSPEGAYIPDGSSCEEGRSGRRMHRRPSGLRCGGCRCRRSVDVVDGGRAVRAPAP